MWTVPSRKKWKKTTNQHTRIPHIGNSGTRYYDDESIMFQLILDICAAREVVIQALFSSFEFCAAYRQIWETLLWWRKHHFPVDIRHLRSERGSHPSVIFQFWILRWCLLTIRTTDRLQIEIGTILFFGKNLLWEIVSDAFGPNWVWRKESSPTFIISERITFSEKSFQTLSDRIESHGRNRFLPLSFQKESLFYIYKYLLKEVKSRRFWMELSLMGKFCFLLFPVRKEIK